MFMNEYIITNTLPKLTVDRVAGLPIWYEPFLLTVDIADYLHQKLLDRHQVEKLRWFLTAKVTPKTLYRNLITVDLASILSKCMGKEAKSITSISNELCNWKIKNQGKTTQSTRRLLWQTQQV